MTRIPIEQRIADWVAALDERVAAQLSPRELHDGLRALSATYVRRRGAVGRGTALHGAAKRAAFALYYAPLHLVTVHAIVDRLGAARPAPGSLLDLGCGSGAAGAGWALACERGPRLTGVELHPWAVEQARLAWRELGLRGRVRRGRLEAALAVERPGAIVLGWAVNELTDGARDALLDELLAAARRGSRWLVVEPIWRRDAAWWDRWAGAVERAGGRSDEWRLEPALPPRLVELGRAAGLDPTRTAARSLWLAGRR